MPKCRKIVGPGSPWVVAAKRLLTDILDPGTPAGPSESIVLADETANPRLVALDLLNESEHGPDSSAYLATNSLSLAEQVIEVIPEYWAQMSDQRQAFSKTVLCGELGGIVVANPIDEAIEFVNDYAPEHLQVHSDVSFDYLGSLRNASEILLGEHCPIGIANYALGPNAVLPTNSGAMTHSPLGVIDFMKSISIGYMTRTGYEKLAPHAEKFARYEGIEAHANAVSLLRDEAQDA